MRETQHGQRLRNKLMAIGDATLISYYAVVLRIVVLRHILFLVTSSANTLFLLNDL